MARRLTVDDLFVIRMKAVLLGNADVWIGRMGRQRKGKIKDRISPRDSLEKNLVIKILMQIFEIFAFLYFQWVPPIVAIGF